MSPGASSPYRLSVGPLLDAMGLYLLEGMMTTMERARVRQSALAYVKAIRNPRKREYALQLLGSTFEGMPEPTRPQGLSLMAAQAVRMQLAELFSR